MAGRRAAALSLAALLAACAAPELPPLAQDPAAASPALAYAPPGTRITLANSVNGRPSETRITVAGASGPRGSFVAEDGHAGGVYPGCWDCGLPMRIDEAAYAALWPLAPGKQTAFIRTSPDGSRARVLIRVGGAREGRDPGRRL